MGRKSYHFLAASKENENSTYKLKKVCKLKAVLVCGENLIFFRFTFRWIAFLLTPGSFKDEISENYQISDL